MTSFADGMRPWHDLYMLLGTASATLIGLLFVAATVGSRYFTKETHAALRVFVSPSVVHFACVFVGCLVALMPTPSWELAGTLVGGTGLYGLVYALSVWRSIVRHGYHTRLDVEDSVYYVAAPILLSGIFTAVGVLVMLRLGVAAELLAGLSAALLLVGIRNAWDMTVWTVIKTDG